MSARLTILPADLFQPPLETDCDTYDLLTSRGVDVSIFKKYGGPATIDDELMKGVVSMQGVRVSFVHEDVKN